VVESEREDTLWTADTAADHHGTTVNLVDGTSFVVSGATGTIDDGTTHGVYLLDTRVISRWQLEVPGRRLQSLSFVPHGPFSGTFVARAILAGQADTPIVVVQRRHAGRGMREDLEIRNHGPACRLDVRLHVDADLAGLFQVKAGHDVAAGTTTAHRAPAGLVLRAVAHHGAVVEAVVVAASEAPTLTDPPTRTLTWTLDLGAGATWSTCLEARAVTRDGELTPAHPCGAPIEENAPLGRLRQWRDTTPDVASDHAGLEIAVRRAVDDLGALRIFDPHRADRVVVAAGAPWFMALFGRDSLFASWMALPFDTRLAEGVLAELADKQGRVHHARTEEQPGRILHEVRFDRLSEQLLGGANTYYGTADATPLFVMLTAELARWSGVTPLIRALMPAVDRAIGWIEGDGDRDGDGFVEYLRRDPAGLVHQGWKDSWDGIRHRDGAIAVPPIALCEVQGYVHAAYRGRASLARALDEGEQVVRSFEERADDLRRRFDETFWMDDLGWYALGLDEHKRPIAPLTSNVGHLLWCGIVPDHRAATLVGHLCSSRVYTGWGLRTLAADETAYNPLSYHCGSVWPHDTAVAVAGLARYGFDEAAGTIATALLDAARCGDGQLPELFGGFDRTDISTPVPYPTSCSPQAWASATPLLLVRAMLGLEPDVPAGELRVRPRVPASVGRLALAGIPIGGRRVDVDATGRSATVTGTPLEVTVG
jgi:glycogen debranching enzyme